jgi:hypothetical protein
MPSPALLGELMSLTKAFRERLASSLGYRTPNEFAEVLQSSTMTG